MLFLVINVVSHSWFGEGQMNLDSESQQRFLPRHQCMSLGQVKDICMVVLKIQRIEWAECAVFV